MIVLGHSGNSRVAMMLGSTANYVLHHTTRPVVVVRGSIMRRRPGVPPRSSSSASTTMRSPRRHVGVRREPLGAGRAVGLRAAGGRARPGRARLVPALAGDRRAHRDHGRDLTMDAAAQAQIDRVLAGRRTRPEGIELVTEPLRGTPGFALIEESRDADLVVVGSARPRWLLRVAARLGHVLRSRPAQPLPGRRDPLTGLRCSVDRTGDLTPGGRSTPILERADPRRPPPRCRSLSPTRCCSTPCR